jgi:ABC-2 type transport system permease protein
MRNVLTVIKHEIITTLSKPSFWATAILFPLFIVGINVFTQFSARQAVADVQAQEAERLAQGVAFSYVDEAGLIKLFPEDVPANLFVEYPTRAAVHQALNNDEIDSYTIITAGYLETGQVIVVQANFNPVGSTPEDLFQYIIAYNLTGDPALTAAINEPLAGLESNSLAPVEETAGRTGSETLAFVVPFGVMMIFFFLLTMGGGYMLQSVSREKENRTVEVLLVSLNPRQLMLGKIVGLSTVALLQMLIWVGGGLFALGGAGQLLGSAAAFEFPPGYLIFALLFFLLGYLLYASMFGAVGALAPSAKESGQLTFIVMFPLLIPLWINQVMIQNPNGTIAMIFSMLPFTAPVSMLSRLVMVDVPLWQVLTSLAGLALTTYLIVMLAARFFRADTLLSTAPIKKESIANALRRNP